MKTTRSNAEQAGRAMAEKVTDLFLDVLLTNEEGLAWENMGLVGRLVDFKGHMPQASGYSQVDTLWRRVDKMRNWSAAHKASMILMRRLSDRQREAVCFDRAYRGRTKVAVDPFVPLKQVEIYWGDHQCAEQLGCSVNAFRKRIQEGYQRLAELVEESGKQAA
ncbi:hypothetical protein [Marinobacter sp. JSM 1782161]|uniref:hypothetical protein n=1 Tax=Marinobacter sp. JSM 1782161 TaxID=2685906 RepID=UPI001402FFE0|nr:hypothetical protein [Marinobacter sp. JSM 1782161]